MVDVRKAIEFYKAAGIGTRIYYLDAPSWTPAVPIASEAPYTRTACLIRMSACISFKGQPSAE